MCFSILACRAGEQAEPLEGKPLVHPGVGAADFQRELDIHVQKTAAPVVETEPDSTNSWALLLCVVLIPGVIVLWRGLAGFFREHFAPLEPERAVRGQTPSDDKLFAEFVAAFEAGAGSAPSANSQQSVSEAKSRTASSGGWGSSLVSAPKMTSLERFFELAPERLEVVRTRFSEVSRASDLATQQKNLEPLSELVRSLVLTCEAPELRPVFQFGRGLEGLLKQMSENASNITPSTLRTAAAGIVLLETICKPGVQYELATAPPARFLVVDDDPISRHAVCASLKKALSAPDVAENGEAALKFAAAKLYDVVFLDIEMPGMDGYEVCSRIHETDINKTTPVVFVTSHNDFDSRTKSIEVGGHDLIGKPFLAFEITVKALTLLLRSRLCMPQAPAPQPSATREKVSADTQAAASGSPSLEQRPSASAAPQQSPAPESPADGDSAIPVPPTTEEFACAFFADAPEAITLLRGYLSALRDCADYAQRQEKSGEIYVAVHTLLREADSAKLVAASRLTSTMLTLLKKFLEKPASVTASAIDTMAAALDLLEEFCGPELKQDLTSPPVRILVVDDDAVTCRALSGAVQVAFEKPEVAQDGEGALVLAQSKAFDMIFMDVRMPGIDGFEACARIHETPLNRQTPVVFVTSQSDHQSRDRAGKAGGCGFIPKPALRMEVTLAALTFAFRGRLEQNSVSAANQEVPVPCPA